MLTQSIFVMLLTMVAPLMMATPLTVKTLRCATHTMATIATATMPSLLAGSARCAHMVCVRAECALALPVADVV